MSGGLLQLASFGIQDVYLTGNPQITFFKTAFRRHTNFSVEVIEYGLTGNINFGERASVKFNKSGDLINKMYLKVVIESVDPMSSNFAWVKRLGHAIIEQIEVRIGGSVIDRQYGTWLDIWYELARRGDHERGYAIMIGDVSEMTAYNSCVKPEYELFIPLKFWFNKHVGLSVPLIALQYHDVVLDINFSKLNSLIIRDSNFDSCISKNKNIRIKSASVLVDFIYLDTDERRRFAIVGHEYLIEQIQFNGIEHLDSNMTKYVLNFNHPTKELIWVLKNGNYISDQQFLYYTNDDVWDPTDAACSIIDKSISVGVDPGDCIDIKNKNNISKKIDWNEWCEEDYCEVEYDKEDTYTKNCWTRVDPCSNSTVGTFNIINNSKEYVYINPESLSIGCYGITNKIKADITITHKGCLILENVETSLTVRDLSIPVCKMTDTRYEASDPIVNQFNNYGLLIDGTINPIDSFLIKFNGLDRFDRREGAYSNYVQPDVHHSNTPKDGINVYSFALFPEEPQPSGSANLSRIDISELNVWVEDSSKSCDLKKDGEPSLDIFNDNNQFHIYGVNYNILRFLSGMSGLAYISN